MPNDMICLICNEFKPGNDVHNFKTDKHQGQTCTLCNNRVLISNFDKKPQRKNSRERSLGRLANIGFFG